MHKNERRTVPISEALLAEARNNYGATAGTRYIYVIGSADEFSTSTSSSYHPPRFCTTRLLMDARGRVHSLSARSFKVRHVEVVREG